MRTILKTLALTAALTSALHAAPLPGWTLVAWTPRFAFYTRGKNVDAAKVERAVSRIENLLGQTVEGRAAYYRYSTPQEVAAGTGYFAAGVTFAHANEVHSIDACNEHELVHLVAGQIGDPGTFFQEGLAVALGNGGKWQGQSVDRTARGASVSVVSLVAAFERVDPATGYAVAGSFVGHLIKTHGIAQVSAFFRACVPGTKDVGKAFAQIFGRSIEAADAEWRASL